MQLVDILEKLSNQELQPGGVTESDEGVKVELLTDHIVRITYLNGESEEWEPVTSSGDNRDSPSTASQIL